MTRRRQEQLLSLLLRDGDWMTAAKLADHFGVTPRSIRSYVTTLNGLVPQGLAVESGPRGYRAGPDAAAAARHVAATSEGPTPRLRLHTIIRQLLDSPDGIDVYETADHLFISSATLDADLAKVRALLAGTELALERSASRVRLRGTEAAQRRLLSRLAHDEMESGSFDQATLLHTLGADSVGDRAFGPFRTELIAELGNRGYFINQIGMADVLTHVTIAADRVGQGRRLEGSRNETTPAQDEVAEVVAQLVDKHLGVQLGAGDLQHLALLVLTRIIAPGASQAAAATRLDPEIAEVVREVVQRAATEFLVDIAHDDFIARLALHVQNLVLRSREQAWSRNPLTRSLKTTHPMIFEVAVYIASELHDRLDIPMPEDEIGYIAMHVGGRLERNRQADQLLTATIVCPGYYELHELLRSSIDRSLGQAVEVVEVETRVDPEWAAIDTDLILSTIVPPVPSDRIVRVQPFLTDADIDRVQQVAARVRRTRRLARLRQELERFFAPDAFVRTISESGDEEAVIRQLGGLLVARGVVDNDYVERTIERERMSSTAFTEALAVPHAIGMTATHTEIAIGIADPAISWGEGRVQVVALVAFSEADREAFQTVFEQFITVFSERDSVDRIVRKGTDFAAFLDELVAIVDG